MKKYFLLLLLAVFAISCSKKVEVKGKIANHSPLERIEVIDASGVATLPLINMGLTKAGEFSGSFNAPKNGMYVITYGQNMNLIYLKQGQTLDISGSGADFPTKFKIVGDAKPNNDFLENAEKSFADYASKIKVDELIKLDEKKFITQFQKIRNDIAKKYDDVATKYKADDIALQWKKDEADAKLLGLLDTYEENHGMAIANNTFKVSKDFAEAKKEILKNNDRMIKNIPVFRDYMLKKLSPEFQKWAQAKYPNPDPNMLVSEAFAEFLKTKKDISQVSKDYFVAYVMSQADINYNNNGKIDKITKLIESNVSDTNVKSDLKKIAKVLMGDKVGTVPNLKVEDKDGKSLNLADLKGKPTLVMFYASWNPNISVMTIPTLKEVNNFYKSKLNFAFVNLDDTKDQFQKTSTALLKGITGQNYWVAGGINADAAKNYGLYGFKIPSYVLLDGSGKVAARPFFNLGDPEMISSLQRLTGLKAPEVQSNMINPLQQGATVAPAPAEAPQTK